MTCDMLSPLALMTEITAKIGIASMENEAIIQPIAILQGGNVYFPLLYVGAS